MNLDCCQQMFASLGEKLRLRIACCLLFWKDGLCVCELVDSLKESQPNISRHLKIMKAAGLVEERREGRWIYYRFISKMEDFSKDLQGCLENVCGCNEVQQDLTRLKDRLRLRKAGRCIVGIQNQLQISRS
jgi:ArsR family transcriptional regulator, arsenate/arsenite/antimonite-responsive transcriptional repressor